MGRRKKKKTQPVDLDVDGVSRRFQAQFGDFDQWQQDWEKTEYYRTAIQDHMDNEQWQVALQLCDEALEYFPDDEDHETIRMIVESDRERQRRTLNLIASENYVSRAVLEAQGSHLTYKYAEGYPGRRYYGGCENVDEIEGLAIERAKELFRAGHANVQPHSGSQANMAVYFALLEYGDTVMAMDLAHGGHLTHGSPVTFSGKTYKFVPYGVNRETERIDYPEVEIRRENGATIIADFGDQLGFGDSVITTRHGTAEIELSDGGSVTVSPDTIYTISEIVSPAGTQTVMAVTLGRVAFRFAAAAGIVEPTIGTPTSVAGVRGTQFTAYVAVDGTTVFIVDEGEVAVTSEGSTVTLVSNQGVEVRSGSAPGERFDALERAFDFEEFNQARLEALVANPVRAIEGLSSTMDRLLYSFARSAMSASERASQSMRLKARSVARLPCSVARWPPRTASEMNTELPMTTRWLGLMLFLTTSGPFFSGFSSPSFSSSVSSSWASLSEGGTGRSV